MMLATLELFGVPAAQFLLAAVLALLSLVAAAVGAWRKWSDSWMGSVFAADEVPRGADDPAPPGVVEYARDLENACVDADAEFLWSALKAGRTRDQARADWIAELLSVNGGG